MSRWETVWSFHTHNLNVELRVAPCEDDPADLFEFQDDIDAVRNGTVEWFDAQVSVAFRDGTELGVDVLCCCAYKTVREFYQAHRDANPLNRNSSIMRAAHGGNTVICHYFPSMVAEACAEARKQLHRLGSVRVRTAA